jgi:hypothetical protein
MKDDHMRNGQLKPAYNIQFASNGAFIVGVMGSQKSNDLHTLIPFLEQMKPRYGNHLNKIVADAGYESVENYNYLKEHHLKSYIKPSNYEQSKKKKVEMILVARKTWNTYQQKMLTYVKMGRSSYELRILRKNMFQAMRIR